MLVRNMLVACAALLVASASSPLSVHAQEQQALPEIAITIQYNSITAGSVVEASKSTNPPGLGGFDVWGAQVTVNSPTEVSVKVLDEIDAGRGDTNADFFVKTPSGSCAVEIAWGDDSKVYASSRYHVGSITCSVSPSSTAVDSRGHASFTVDVHSSPEVAVWSLTKAAQQNRKLPKAARRHRAKPAAAEIDDAQFLGSSRSTISDLRRSIAELRLMIEEIGLEKQPKGYDAPLVDSEDFHSDDAVVDEAESQSEFNCDAEGHSKVCGLVDICRKKTEQSPCSSMIGNKGVACSWVGKYTPLGLTTGVCAYEYKGKHKLVRVNNVVYSL